ncbi:hypothetical protein ABRQ00_10960 [Pectobacterium aroidearum]|uniref:hypothetical protein n=2 Tax=Pectobacterium aroidearum TaxID=1201031 RepID=UPI0032F0549E
MTAACFSGYDFYQSGPERFTLPDGTLENRDGNIMYIADRVFDIDTLEEVDMTINTDRPLTIGWAIGLCTATVVSVILCAGGIYAFLQSDLNNVRSDISSLRTDARDDVKSTNAQINEVNKTLTSIQVDVATLKATKN